MEPWYDSARSLGITSGRAEVRRRDESHGKSGPRAVPHAFRGMGEEIAWGIEAEGDVSRRRFRGGQSYGLTGNDDASVFAINGRVVKAKYCEHLTLLLVGRGGVP